MWSYLKRERDLFEDLSADGRIILAWMLMRGFGLDLCSPE
jgi:hypothetical protein